MKKYLYGLAAVIAIAGISISSVNAAYKQQGFNQYHEDGSGVVSFRCQSTCVLLISDTVDNDVFTLHSESHQGTGLWGYGYLVGGNIYPASMLPADSTSNSYQWSLADDSLHDQIPTNSNAQVVFLVSGPLLVNNLTLHIGPRSFSDTFTWGRQRFRRTETLAPYSINLHYGPKIGSWGIQFSGLIIMLLVVVLAYIVRKKLSVRHTLMIAVSTLTIIMIIGGARLLMDDIRITDKGIRSFSHMSDDQKTFFDIKDYTTVTNKVRTYLHLDDMNAWKDKKCNIYAKSNADRPFGAHRASVYLRPCTVVQTGSLADYELYYNVPPVDATGSMVLSGSDFVLFSTKN